MIIYYAVGGGLGHLTRARAVLNTLSIKDDVAILASSPFARDRRVTGDADVILVPDRLTGDLAGYGRWLSDLLDRRLPSEVYLDTFPAGILGEFCDFPLARRASLIHIARLLRWPEYSKQLRGAPPLIDVTYRVESLTKDHEDFLRARSLEVRDLSLKGAYQSARVDEGAKRVSFREPLWLIVHSGPDEEILELVSYAVEMSRIERVDPSLILIAPRRPVELPGRVTHLDLYPASSLYSKAERIITACGFNAMCETEPYREKHRFYPFPRRFDDQFLRASQRAISRNSRGASLRSSLRD
jgi:hypothetical protein